MRSARRCGSGHGNGSLNSTMTPSPVQRSSVPSNARSSLPRLAWYSRNTPITSSGFAVSAKAVNPRRSQKTTLMSRRWLSNTSPSPEERTSSASCGARNRFNRLTRSISATCSVTRFSSVRFQSASSLACACTWSCSALIRSAERTRATSACWSTGLARDSAAPRSTPADQVARIGFGGDEDDRHERQRATALERAAHLEAVELGHHHVEQDEARQLRPGDGERLLAVGRLQQLVAMRAQPRVE